MTPKTSTSYRAIGVVVPARDEQEWIADCLNALLRAVEALPATVRVHVIVVADGCTDDTARIALETLTSTDSRVLDIQAANVGVARAAGFAAAIATLGARCTWLVTTDADTTVRPLWLSHQLRLAQQGWHGVAGTVEVDHWELRSPRVRRAFERLRLHRGVGDGHSHVHGANLGFSATAYREAGGMPGIPTAEDHGLWEALAHTGRPLLSSGDLVVRTGARRSDRAPRGFSHLLDESAPHADAMTALNENPRRCDSLDEGQRDPRTCT